MSKLHQKYNKELQILTNGKVDAASEIKKLRDWMMGYGVSSPSLDADSVQKLLSIQVLPQDVRRALEIREIIGSAAVKKLYAMLNQLTPLGRVHDLFIYHSARTGRAAGAGPQPQNLPNSGPLVAHCGNCKKYFNDNFGCPWCGFKQYHVPNVEWCPQAVENALETINTGSLDCVGYFWSNPIAVVAACLRGLFIAAPRHDLICSDYSAIEAVVLAMLSGEQWRIDVFNTHGKIYEACCSYNRHSFYSRASSPYA